MRSNKMHARLIKPGLLAATLLVASATAFGAPQQVNLTAAPSTLTLPDGAQVPMWGYSCGAAVTGSTASCASLNANAAGGWSPVVITVPTGQGLTVNLTNSLASSAGGVPTSLVIVGQLGGGLGDPLQRTTTAPPDHSGAQGATTWPIAGGPGGTAPTQGPRVQSFATEVAVGATTAVTWNALLPGTYLIESGTHPSIQAPMGLYGILVVTTAPANGAAGIAYPNVTYSTDVPLLLSEIDPVQNAAVNTAVNTAGFSETRVWSGQPGGCGNPASGAGVYQTCYPPAVDYSPRYYLINGVGFSRSNAAASLFNATAGSAAAPVTGNVLVRIVNAGLRMHVPSIVGALTGSPTAVSGMSLIAEDGNPLPGLARVQSEVFLAAGKTYDVSINVPASGATALPFYDRELSLSGNATARDAGMLAYLGINGSGLPAAPSLAAATATADHYDSVVAGQTLVVSDPGKGVLSNDVNVNGAQVTVGPTQGTLALNTDGTFTYAAGAGFTSPDSFTYCGNGTTSGAACAVVTLNGAVLEAGSGITLNPVSYTSTVASHLAINSPGILAVDTDGEGLPLTVDTTSITASAGLSVSVDASGSFDAAVTGPGTYTFTYKAKNSQGTVSAATGTVTLVFPVASNLAVTVLDGTDKVTAITDYRWIIEEDRTFYVDPKCTTNPPPAGCPTAGGIVPTFGTNFHTSFMPVIATGCTGTLSCESGQTVLGTGAVCDVGDGVCRTDASQRVPVNPSQVALDPAKRYYISILPGDAANPFETGNLTANCANGSAGAGASAATCGHGMGGAPIAAGQTAVTVLSQPAPYPPARLSVFVFEDDFPLNGEQDGGGGVDTLSPNEPGLGGFNITIMDDAGGTGDATGQVDYDMFNQPLSNSLAGTIDPVTGKDACPVGPNHAGITGTIVTCPKYEADGVTLSPLAGQAVVANMMPGRYGVVATEGADRIAAGEEWLQTNTLDGQKAHDSFLRIGEPNFFQEFGPAGYHVSIGFANPKIIQSRLAGVCNGSDPNLGIGVRNCNNTLSGKVTTERMSRTPDERLYSSGTHDSFAFTQCYVSFGDPDGEDFAFTKCAADGTFSIAGLPDGDWRVTVFDQWNDELVDGLSTPVRLSAGASPATTNVGDIATSQWQANFYTRTFFDSNRDGISQAAEPGLALVKTNVRYRDGSFSNLNNTDLDGYAAFNEEFPLFSWYVIETDTTRFKNTGTHVVYDAGGPADGSTSCGPTAPCGNSAIGANLANTVEVNSVPAALRVPGAVYCATADCTGKSIAGGPATSDPPSVCTTATDGTVNCTTQLSTGRIDPPWVLAEGWQGFSGQNNFLEFGKAPFANGENGGIYGHVVYASTRPFDDPQFNTQNTWEPLVPGVTVNLYREGTAADGTATLTLVDTTKTSSWDDWAQGFRSDGVPNMNCPGQSTSDLFYFTLQNQPMWLDAYSNGGTPAHTVPNNSQFKCYDGMHNWNQLQPAPYDGMYRFPSVTAIDPQSGKPTATNCTGCMPNPDSTDSYRFGTPMLPDGKYVVEMVVPPGYELVKEEDKNILIGDNFIAPVTVEFPGLGSAIYILPDQAEVSASYNANNAQNATNSMGRQQPLPSHEGDMAINFSFWPCVGATRTVPDYISLFPQSAEVAPFAGATRNLCDRKEVPLDDQSSAQVEFFVFTPTHAAAHFTGVITDDFTSEFDPFSPQFGEKFSPANMPVSIKDWTGTEISRVYADEWGAYNGLTYSTWEVNPPNPTGYSPTMMVTCMNDAGNGVTPDPLYNPAYSQFCYEIPFMPGQTQYMDTPVVPTSAQAGAGYNLPDCSYPDATPAVSEVDGDAIGPWVSAPGKTLTINALGNQLINNNAYTGPAASTAPYNQKTTTRHYGFGSQCSATGGACAAVSAVTIGGIPATITGWSDTQITVTVPSGVPACPLQQQAIYGGSSAQCGQLSITAGNGKQSIDSVTVTIGGKSPTHVLAGGSIQAAIDAAAPGDLIMVNPGVYHELLLMWKPLRLQGVGAASSILDANAHPAGKLNPWRRQVNCLFGLALDGTPLSASNPYDPTHTYSCPAAGWNYAATPTALNPNPTVDRLPLEAVVGWDATLNGNLAEQLQEPTLMGAYEGAGITVLAKGVRFTNNSLPFAADTFPTDTTLLAPDNCLHGSGNTASNPFPSNFHCNPSSIDGLSITNSSQGGGGIYVHAWAHNIQIANNRVHGNTGTLTGGITIGQGEFPSAYTSGPAATNAAPGSCQANRPMPPNTQEPYCFDLNVNVHNNYVTSNSSIGDELFSSTPAGAGGVTFCTGSDYYKFNYNWLCGNLSSGDGGGLAQLGFVYNADIEHNQILFNQATNPTVPTNGGGMIIMGAPDTDPTCTPGGPDADCAPGASDGTGPGMVINANLFMGNAADSGSGGALRLQGINGTDVETFPNSPQYWYGVKLTNNIIVNNVAGWDGAGLSLQDALAVNMINNTVMSNDTTASSGVLFNTIGAPIASSTGPTCTANSQPGCGTTSLPQPAGLVAIQNSAALAAILPATITCPNGHFAGTTALNGTCRTVSYPMLYNNVFWQNRSYYIGVGSLGTGTLNQQNVVALYTAFTTTAAPSQPQADATTPNGAGVVITGGTGACTPASYWDIGVRGDSGPRNHESLVTLAPHYSVLTDITGYGATDLHNQGLNPEVTSQYCNGSRVPPEFASMGYQVPPGISDATVPNPVFNLTPSATVDEGNNWINMSWGPLSEVNPVSGAVLGDYSLSADSPAINYIPPGSAGGRTAPNLDYFGHPRPAVPGTNVDVGAIEYQASLPPPALTAITPATGLRNTTVAVTLTGSSLAGVTGVTVSGTGVTVSAVNAVNDTTVTATFTISATATRSARNVTVTSNGGTSNAVTFTVQRPQLAAIVPNAGVRGTSVPITLTGAGLTGATALNVNGTGITVSGFTAVNDTTVTATLGIANNASLTTRTITVTTPSDTSSGIGFTVQGATLASISPNAGTHNTSVNLTLTGTNLSGVTSVNIGGGGVTVSNVHAVNATTVTATFGISNTATRSTRNVNVTTTIGTTNVVTFTVN